MLQPGCVAWENRPGGEAPSLVSRNSSDSRSTAVQWLLLDGNRLVVSGLILTGTFLLLLGFGWLGFIDVQDEGAVRGVATAFIPGLIAFLSIVIAINQLVLSQEFGSADEIRDRIESIREYRHDVEDLAGTGTSPVLPSGFLSFVLQIIRYEAREFEARTESGSESESVPIQQYARTIIDESTHALKSLEQLQQGRFNALLPVLEYKDSYQLYEARRLQRDHADALLADAEHSLDRLIETLELFSIARTQFRSTYTQRVLAGLSRKLLYAGIPALVVAILLALIPAPGETLAAETARMLVVSALLSIGLSPLAVLSAYLLRDATVSEWTVSAGPFASRPGVVQEERDPEGEGYSTKADIADDERDEDESA